MHMAEKTTNSIWCEGCIAENWDVRVEPGTDDVVLLPFGDDLLQVGLLGGEDGLEQARRVERLQRRPHPLGLGLLELVLTRLLARQQAELLGGVAGGLVRVDA